MAKKALSNMSVKYQKKMNEIRSLELKCIKKPKQLMSPNDICPYHIETSELFFVPKKTSKTVCYSTIQNIFIL